MSGADECGDATLSDRSRNVLANYVSMFVKLLGQVVLVPICVSSLGSERFGVIGFFITVQSLLVVFDFGLGVSLNRELARLSTMTSQDQLAANMIRSVEVLSWGIGSCLGFLMWVGAPLLATDWLSTKSLSIESLTSVIRLMGLALAAQWPLGVYNGGLQGIQRQELMVKITIASNVFFSLGTIILLKFWPLLETFFVWRIAVSLVTLGATRRSLLKNIFNGTSGAFDWASTATIRNFSGGMTLIALTGIILSQWDKILASRFLPLPLVGSYMVASTGAALVSQLVSPVFTAFFPAVSQAFARGDTRASVELFRKETRLISLFAHPAVLVLALFPGAVLTAWTGDEALARVAAPILSTIAIGSGLNSMMVPIYTVQLSAGWTSLALTGNLFLMVTIIPFGIVVTRQFGAVGAAATWLGLNFLYLAIGYVWTVRKLDGISFYSFLNDVMKPLAVALSIVGAFRMTSMAWESHFSQVLFASLGGVCATLGVTAFDRDLRRKIASAVRTRLERTR